MRRDTFKRDKQPLSSLQQRERKSFTDPKQIALLIIGFFMSCFQLWSVLFAKIDPITQMAIHLSFILVLTFLVYRFSGQSDSATRLPMIDLIWMVLAGSCGVYYYLHAERIATRIVGVDALTTSDIFFGVAFILLCIEAVRRTIGYAIIIVASLFLTYALFGHLLSGIWYHRPITLLEMIDHFSFSYNGLWGSPISVAASFVFIFILFGAFLKKSGAGEFFYQLSVAIAGRTRGGSAKIAILASALFGSISGSPTANVVTTGPFTIPTAKKAGYSAKFAAAIEAIASTGGSLLPPIMGSAAFLMVAVTGIPYKTIAIAAILPGMLFYASLFIVVHLEALRLNLPKADEKDIPQLGKVIKRGWFHFIPVLVLVFFLLQGYSPSRTGVYGIIAIIIVSLFRGQERMKIWMIIEAMKDGAKSAIPISTACAAAGLVIAGIMTTGLGGKLNSIILSMTAGQLLPSLLVIMIICIILGMGMPVAAAYVLTAMLAAPTLIGLGVSPLGAHLFIVYFSIISAITPPVAVAAFAAAGIAKANPTKVGIEALRLGLTSFAIPFLFIYHPALLLDGSLLEVSYAIAMSGVGISVIGSSVVGFFFIKINGMKRFILLLTGILVLLPTFFMNMIGLIIVALLFLYQHKKGIKIQTELSIS